MLAGCVKVEQTEITHPLITHLLRLKGTCAVFHRQKIDTYLYRSLFTPNVHQIRLTTDCYLIYQQPHIATHISANYCMAVCYSEIQINKLLPLGILYSNPKDLLPAAFYFLCLNTSDLPHVEFGY